FCRSCVFFLSLLSRPPSLSLFPYTTLFRSLNFCGTLFLPGTDHVIAAASTDLEFPGLVFRVLRVHANIQIVHPTIVFFFLAQSKDRKSTRLNSSHEWISYAVFCLKKKKLSY